MIASKVPGLSENKSGGNVHPTTPDLQDEKSRVENLNSANFYLIPASNAGEGQQLNFSWVKDNILFILCQHSYYLKGYKGRCI